MPEDNKRPERVDPKKTKIGLVLHDGDWREVPITSVIFSGHNVNIIFGMDLVFPDDGWSDTRYYKENPTLSQVTMAMAMVGAGGALTIVNPYGEGLNFKAETIPSSALNKIFLIIKN